MKDWRYTFDPVSKEEWIKQIERDLKHKSIDSLQSEWWPGEPLIPTIHKEDIGGESIRLPDTLFTSPPRMLEWVDGMSETPFQVNKKILSSLHYGAEAVILQISASAGPSYIDWFKGVHVEMVSLNIQFDHLTSNTITSLIGLAPGFVLIRLLRSKSSQSFQSLINPMLPESKTAVERLRFVYNFPSQGNWIVETSGVLNQLISDLSDWNAMGFSRSSFFQQCILYMEADVEYFKLIIQTRVLHLLWQNLKQNYAVDIAPENDKYMESHMVQVMDEKPDHFLIRASMAALGSILAGTHGLCIHHSDSENTPGFYSRINRNIHHLLHLESGMYKGTDPLSGAYAIDFYTRKWTEEIWKKIV